jgi:MFS family permease
VPAAVWALVIARTVNRLGAFTLTFLTVLLTRRLGASVAEAGLLLTVFGLATIPSRLAGGQLADRIGRRTTIVVGLVGCAAGQLALAAAGSLAQAFAAVVLLGLVFEVYEAPSQAMVADLVEPADRPAAYGLLAAAMAMAGLVAGLLATVLSGIDLRLLFVVDAVTCLVAAVIVRVMLPSGRVGSHADRSAWWDRRLLAMVACGTCFAVVYLQVLFTLPLTIDARLHDPRIVGLVLAVSALTVVLAQPLLRAAGLVTALVGGYLLLGVGLGAYAVADTVPAFLVATVVWSVGDVLLLGRMPALVADLAPPDRRGRYLAVYGSSWGIAGVVAPLLGTQVLAHGGPATLWLGAAVVCVVLAAVQPALVRDRPQVMVKS